MAFWGIEVKPGRSFTHPPLSRRLHLSLATLGLGDGVGKSIVQCNVGNKKALFLCSLFPDMSECCQINLEFEESDEVVFSVIGSRTVHLAGYYLSTSSLNDRKDDDTVSYGEDIGDTESEKSSDESEYGGSFIDDNDEDDPQVFSSSGGSESNEEMPYTMKVRRRRLMKMVDSETDDENLPISSFSFRKRTPDMKEKAKKEAVNHNDNEIEDNTTNIEETNVVINPEPECPQDASKLKRKRENDLEEKPLTEDVCMEKKEAQNQCNESPSKKKKKKKKKIKSKDKVVDAANTEPYVVEMEVKNPNNKEIQLLHGIIVEDLDMGKPYGEIAALGKKVRVHYTIKLRDSGEVIDSNLGQPPLKFRLGGEKVTELWNVGIEGLHVGGKRRIMIPPRVSYASEETSENIPPNSWMILDVELMKVK